MMARSDKTPKGGLYRPDIVRAVLSGHSVLGIAFAAVIYLVCLTGALSVFQQDFTLWEQPHLPRVEHLRRGRGARRGQRGAARGRSDALRHLPR
jgi:uncharacterized iron-regulated membrane protein